MPQPPITVKNAELRATGKGRHLYCTMSDGSEWTSDIDGKMWVQVKLSDSELTDLFNNNPKKRLK